MRSCQAVRATMGGWDIINEYPNDGLLVATCASWRLVLLSLPVGADGDNRIVAVHLSESMTDKAVYLTPDELPDPLTPGALEEHVRGRWRSV